MSSNAFEESLNILQLFDALDEPTLASWLTQGQEENLHLDFKTLQREDLSHADDKKNLAKALSGFANSDGGLIIWGVDARPSAQGTDCAGGFKLIGDVARILARLNDLTGEYVSPRVDGVVHRAVPFANGKSCIVTLVPASDAGPHMAKGGENRYYKRSGSSFYCMEHFDLEDMFGRRKRPKLVLIYRFEANGGSFSGGAARHDTLLVLRLANTGRGVAKSPFVGFNTSAQFALAPRTQSTLPKLEPSLPGVHQFGASSQYVIHPGVTIDLASIGYAIINEHGKVVLPPPLTILFEVAAEDMRLETGEIKLTAEDLLYGRFPSGVVPIQP